MPDNAFTKADLVDEKRPGEHYIRAFFRSIFAAIDICMTESGCPLSPEQRAALHEAVGKSGVNVTPP